MDAQKNHGQMEENLSLSQAAEHLLEECRMVLPGIQALFGFQLIAVFNSGFKQELSGSQRLFHLLAIALVAIAAALIMTPAAYHRQACPDKVTKAFVKLSTRFLLWSMLPLAAGVCIDFYLVADIIVQNATSWVLSSILFLAFIMLWFIFPRMKAAT